jgi:galactose oxidase
LRIGIDGGPIHRVTLLALGSMTHSFDANQRCVVLFDGEAPEEEVSIVGPRDAHVAPPGDYLLFVLRRVETWSGDTFVPSVARVVRVR